MLIKMASQMPKETDMTERADLLKEIDNLPHKYFGEVLDFAGYLRQKDIKREATEPKGLFFQPHLNIGEQLFNRANKGGIVPFDKINVP
jgi:hypothetical protein